MAYSMFVFMSSFSIIQKKEFKRVRLPSHPLTPFNFSFNFVIEPKIDIILITVVKVHT